MTARQREHHVDTMRAQDLDRGGRGLHDQLPVTTSAPKNDCSASIRVDLELR
jgi:hypothetical protein